MAQFTKLYRHLYQGVDFEEPEKLSFYYCEDKKVLSDTIVTGKHPAGLQIIERMIWARHHVYIVPHQRNFTKETIRNKIDSVTDYIYKALMDRDIPLKKNMTKDRIRKSAPKEKSEAEQLRLIQKYKNEIK